MVYNRVHILLIATGLMITISGCANNPQNNTLNISSNDTLDNYPRLFEKNTTIVVGENATSIELDGAKLIAYDISNLTGYEPIIKNDTEVTGESRHNNLILIGRAKTNKVINNVYEIANVTRVTDEYPGAGKGILELVKNPWNENNSMLLVEGSDKWGVRAGSVVLEDHKQLKDKSKFFVDWKEATGITIPINNSEDAIKYAKTDADVKKYIKEWSSYSIEAGKDNLHGYWTVSIIVSKYNLGRVDIYPDGTLGHFVESGYI